MIVSIHQPSYFPWLGLLHKIHASDVYVLMDEVQLADRAYQHRNLFMMANGKTKFLTIPFVRKDYRNVPLSGLRIADDGWREEHRQFLSNNYRKHPYCGEVMPGVEAYLAASYETVGEAITASMRLAFDWFGVTTRVLKQSELDYDRTLARGDLIMELLRVCGADTYLSGTGAKAYLDESLFTNGLALEYQEFAHPEYEQRGAPEFVAGLSCLDILFNLGVDGARRLLDPGSAN